MFVGRASARGYTYLLFIWPRGPNPSIFCVYHDMRRLNTEYALCLCPTLWPWLSCLVCLDPSFLGSGEMASRRRWKHLCKSVLGAQWVSVSFHLILCSQGLQLWGPAPVPWCPCALAQLCLDRLPPSSAALTLSLLPLLSHFHIHHQMVSLSELGFLWWGWQGEAVTLSSSGRRKTTEAGGLYFGMGVAKRSLNTDFKMAKIKLCSLVCL